MLSDRNKNLKVFQEKLSLKREQILAEIENRRKESKSKNDSQLKDLADMATDNLQDELSMMAAEEEIKKLKQIDNALARIDSNKYGVCVSCGCEINIERLKALPFATLCVECKENEEKDFCPNSEGYSYGKEIEFDYDSCTDEDVDVESNIDSDSRGKKLI